MDEVRPNFCSLMQYCFAICFQVVVTTARLFVCAATVMRCAFARVTVATWMASRPALSRCEVSVCLCACAYVSVCLCVCVPAVAQGLVGGSTARPQSSVHGRGSAQ